MVATYHDFLHQCGNCGARACVAAPVDVARMRFNSRDLMAWYLRGQRDERARAAAADIEHATALASPRPAAFTASARRSELITLFRRKAEEVAISMGRNGYRPYNGGPVDFESGRPLASPRSA